jgi:sugar phosphate isomerase/epimerase
MAPVLKSDRSFVERTLEDANLVLGIENHPERTPAEMLEQIGPNFHPRIGTTLDTGWYGTQGFDAVEAIRQLRPHIVLVHLKDVRQAGEHRTCAYGDGIVPVRDCVSALTAIEYEGDITVEHEPDDYDPRSEIVASKRLLRQWLDGPHK